MKKYSLILMGVCLLSCNTTKTVRYRVDQKVTLTWEDKKADTFDVYSSDTLLVMKVPCLEANQMTIHGYPPGNYKFVFKSNGSVVETKKIIINN